MSAQALSALALNGYRSTSPPGSRSCHAGGSWEMCTPHLRGGGLAAELTDAFSDLEPTVAARVRADLLDLMRDAEDGALTYGRGQDVEAMQATSGLVLELRHPVWDGEDRLLAQFRFYFTEPESVFGCLLALHLTRKCLDESGKEQQNVDAFEAMYRIAGHFGYVATTDRR